MRGALTDSTTRRSRDANFVRFRDLYVTLFHGRRPFFRKPVPVRAFGFPRSARSAVDDSGDFSPCRKTQTGVPALPRAGGGRSGRAAARRLPPPAPPAVVQLLPAPR